MATADPYATIVPDAKYRVSFVTEEKFAQFGRDIWAVTMMIVNDGPHMGLPILWFLNVPRNQMNSPNSSIVQAYVAVTGRRPPRGLSRGRPSRFLQDCEVEVETHTVEQDRFGRPHPEQLRYSRVQLVVQRTAGVPPCLRERDR